MKRELSDREQAVLRLASQGYTDEGIARELGIQTGTVNSYWIRIRGKMGHYSRTELVARHVQGEADSVAAKQLLKTNGEAEDQSKLLAAANNEIERLKKLLAEEG